MGLKTYKLQWRDGVTVTDLRATTDETGLHTYQFGTSNMKDAEELVRVFRALNPQHDFSNGKLVEVKDEEKK